MRRNAYARRESSSTASFSPPWLVRFWATASNYLAWEIGLVHQMADDDDQRFRVVAG